MFGSGADSDADAPLELNDNDYQTSVPVNTVQISHEMLALLEEQHDVFADDGRDASLIYQSCVQYIKTYLNGNDGNL